MNPENKNEAAQMAAKIALEQQAEEAYKKRLAEKRAMRARTSAVGIDNPFDVPKQFLDPKFHYMIVNDAPGRVSMFQARGYELVTDKDLSSYLNQKPGDPVKFATGMNEPAWAYLMKIEKELHEEDMAAIQKEADEKMQTLGVAPGELSFAADAQVDGVNLDKKKLL